MYKVTIAKKLRLRSTFSRAVLYSRWNVMDLELIKPITVIVMLANKQFIRNIRLELRLNKLIRYNKESVLMEYRLGDIK